MCSAGSSSTTSPAGSRCSWRSARSSWSGSCGCSRSRPPSTAVFQAYKHQATRRYLHVDHQGCAYAFRGERNGRDRYEQIPLPEAIELALCSWKYLGASADELALVDAAIERARDGLPEDPED
jgi:hypothetical protein